VQLNVRNDNYSDFGSASTYFVGYGFRFNDAWRANASVSTGFNVPSFNDLFNPFGGNPLLKPEHLKSSEIGLQYAQAGQEVRALYFMNRYTDLIGNDSNFNRVNIDNAQNNGVELSYLGRFGGTSLRAGATAQNPIDSSTGKPLLRRAKSLANVGISRDMGVWSLGGNLRYSGARDDRFAGNTLSLPSYSVLDLNASYAINKAFKAFGRIDNVLNKSYETAYGYRQAPRGIFVGLNWQGQ
jgi:vitamin B12 transporter